MRRKKLATGLDTQNIREQLKSQLQETISRANARGEIAIITAADPNDVAAMTSERELMVSNLNNANKKLRAIQNALTRLKNGTFGDCIECGDAINPTRLRAVPWAERCVGCQEAHEAERPSNRDLGEELLLA